MIELGVLKDKNKTKQLFEQNNLEFGGFSVCVSAVSAGDELGYCLLDIGLEKTVVYCIEPLNDVPLADGILRSALHVSAERGVMNAFYADTLSEEFLNKIGFIKNQEEKRLDIDKLFSSCCSCK
ncbi:MAG: hypothetical protein IKD04_06940 [Clostridia bacterium]|nr:hypothetical protein [Clostridia bacterium]